MSDPPPGAASASERPRLERHAAVRLADLTLPELRRIAVTSVLGAVVLLLFLWMVRTVIVAAILGIIIAFYLRPLDHHLTRRLRGHPHLAALIALTAVILPFVAMALYSYFELIRVADYVATHERELSAEITAGLRRIPWLAGRELGETVHANVQRAAAFAAELPAGVGVSLGHFAVAATIFLLTAFYFLTRGEVIAGYLRRQVPPRYSRLVSALEENVSGVLYGAIFATLVTQALKSAILFALFLLFAVPLAAVLAVAAFVIGFFPIVGSWSVYLPVAVWLLIFRGDPLGALVVVAVGAVVNTLFISTYLRPKLAADRSHVLDFYWMFLGLVTGVYTFGLPGVVLGPILIGLLKAIFDTVVARESWSLDREQGTV